MRPNTSVIPIYSQDWEEVQGVVNIVDKRCVDVWLVGHIVDIFEVVTENITRTIAVSDKEASGQ